VGEIKNWTPPANFGSPVNSSVDDVYFIKGKNKEEGFFASNRKGGVTLQNPTCCDDLYSYKYRKYIRILLAGNVFEVKDTSSLKYADNFGAAKDVRSKDGTETAEFDKVAMNGNKVEKLSKMPVSIYLSDGGEDVFLRTDSSGKDGEFLFALEQGHDYRIVASSEDFFARKINVTTKNIFKSDTLFRYLAVRRIPKGPIIVKNIYYPFDKAELTPEALKTIDTTLIKIMTENPEIIIEISSHTDSKGKDDYNMKLSQRRAESVVNYMIQNGIAKERLVAKGYGETMHIAPNENPDKSDNEKGRQMNRRTEFKVIGVLKKYSDVIYED
jgi:outer membrane protein OmpA-like peptidoglycan-associated protein